VVGERADDDAIRVRRALERSRLELLLQLGSHTEQDDAAVARRRPFAAAGRERDVEAIGQDAEDDVVHADAAFRRFRGHPPLELRGHPNDHTLEFLRADSTRSLAQSAITCRAKLAAY
jgi:hypothetical protein